MSRVYVVQRQLRRDEKTRQLVPRFPLISRAEEFGPLTYLLSQSVSPFEPEPVIDALHEGLREFTSEDYLLLIGNPILIGLTVAIAADYSHGSLNALQWSGSRQEYIPVELRSIFTDI